MKGLGALFFAVGLASAASINQNAQISQSESVASQTSSGVQSESTASVFSNSSDTFFGSQGSQGSQGQVSSADSSFDPASLDLSNVGGVNLGQIDFSDQSSVTAAILSMLNLVCAGDLFDTSNILDLGFNDEMEMLLELVQLMQLEQLGFLDVSDIQSLLGLGFGSSFSSGSDSNVFNLGTWKGPPRQLSKKSVPEYILTLSRFLQAGCLRSQKDHEAN